jgi:hypothetical protein
MTSGEIHANRFRQDQVLMESWKSMEPRTLLLHTRISVASRDYAIYVVTAKSSRNLIIFFN